MSLLLPWVDVNTIEEPKLKRVIGYEGLQRTVCIVDDDPVLRGLLSDLLVPIGFNVVEANDAPRCMELVEQVHIDLFLMDISMPGMSGLELVHKLREQGNVKPVIMLSADAHEYNRKDDYQADYDDYLVKPVSNHQLFDKISQYLELEWIYRNEMKGGLSQQGGLSNGVPSIPVMEAGSSNITPNQSLDSTLPKHALLLELKAYAQMGYQKGVNATLKQILNENLLDESSFRQLEQLSQGFQFEKLALHIEAYSV